MFSTNELTEMQETNERHMMDTCVLQTWSSGSSNAFGERVETWTDGAALACGFNPKGGREVAGGGGEVAGATVILTDASVRLPIATEVDRKDRIKITHRFGVELAAPSVFEVIGEARRGPSGLQLDLRRASL